MVVNIMNLLNKNKENFGLFYFHILKNWINSLLIFGYTLEFNPKEIALKFLSVFIHY